jgi:hypothetical protein
MNADLTINSIVFAKSFDEKDGSERRSTARGINTADIMSIKRQDALNSKTKVAEKRYLARFDQENIDATSGKKYVTSGYVVLVVPELATSTDVSDIVATVRAAVASTSPNYITQILNSES